jgi:hypothetical protein
MTTGLPRDSQQHEGMCLAPGQPQTASTDNLQLSPSWQIS